MAKLHCGKWTLQVVEGKKYARINKRRYLWFCLHYPQCSLAPNITEGNLSDHVLLLFKCQDQIKISLMTSSGLSLSFFLKSLKSHRGRWTAVFTGWAALLTGLCGKLASFLIDVFFAASLALTFVSNSWSGLSVPPSLTAVYFRAVDSSSRYDGGFFFFFFQKLKSVFHKLLPEKGRPLWTRNSLRGEGIIAISHAGLF